MSGTDVSSYDLFSLKHYDEEPLPLDEASRRASQLRKENPGKIYRVTIANAKGDRFHVDSLSPMELSAQILARLSARWAKMLIKESRHHG